MSTKKLDQIADKWKEYIEDHPKMYEPNIPVPKSKLSKETCPTKKPRRLPTYTIYCRKCKKPYSTHSNNSQDCDECTTNFARLKKLGKA